MIKVKNILVDEKIFVAKFACDYEKCKGSCCYGKSSEELWGGALSDYDAALIQYYRGDIRLLCDKEEQNTAFHKPVTLQEDGNFYTTLSKGKCVLCSKEKGGCVLKMANSLKIAPVDIPLSCNLYPIIWQVDNGVDKLVISDLFDKDYCHSAYTKGERDNIYMIDFLKGALIRAFGEDFYDKLKEVQRDFL